MVYYLLIGSLVAAAVIAAGGFARVYAESRKSRYSGPERRKKKRRSR